MKLKLRFILALFFTLWISTGFSQGLDALFPTNLANHTAQISGDWDNTSTWGSSGVPGEGAIIYIPNGITVNYNSTVSGNPHLFIIRVDGTLNISQPDPTKTTRMRFDTMFTGMMSNLNIIANSTSTGQVIIDINPFDIMGNPVRNTWTNAQKNHFTDNAPVKQYTYTVTGDDRYDTLDEANNSTDPLTVSRTLSATLNSGVGVLGRYQWDPKQVSLGIMTMGNVNIDGLEKTNMVKLGADALSGSNTVQLSSIPSNWTNNDDIIITSGGNDDATNNGEDLVKLSSNVTGTTLNLSTSLNKNHEGRNAPNLGQTLHCYAGNLTRSITIKSPFTTNVDERGHIMAMNMGNNPNVSIKNALFLRLGRTDKSRPTDDFYFGSWLAPGAPISKVSTLGMECAQMIAAAPDEITNSRGRYSIHLHKMGASSTSPMAIIKGNVVWDNPGWGITHHDSHADISKNVVYNVIGAGIVSETGSETGLWADNLVTNVQAGYNGDVYESSLYYDDILFSGVGLGMKGRAVLCKNNVVTNARFGIRVINFNNSISNLDRVDAQALAVSRPGYEVDNFPLNRNGYSKYGDGVLPLEASLIMENTTIIDCNNAMKSIERDMGVNHESRSVFDGFIAWGIRSGLGITYQADYSYKDVYISGDGTNNTLGIDLWKHSHNQSFENITLADLTYGIKVSKLVLNNNTSSTTIGPKVRNNGFTPWLFVDFNYSDNVTNLYELEIDNPSTDPSYQYEQCTDNTIILPSSEFSARETTFTLKNDPTLDYNSTGETALRFNVDGYITDDFGVYDMGVQQSLAQGDLRLGYPERIYQFASQAKFIEYLNANGVYKDEANGDQLYFIINESLPNRRTFNYTTFPVRVKILNAPSTAPFSNPQVETPSALAPKNELISVNAVVSQSSTAPNTNYNDGFSVEGNKPVNYIAQNAVDGNNNGRINVNYYQRDLVPFVGSQSKTQAQFQPWYELDFGEMKTIESFDLWNTVDLPANGQDEESVSSGFNNFYVFISDTPFSSMSAQDTATLISESDYAYYHTGGTKRKVSQDGLSVVGRYMRIQSNKTSNTAVLKFAEIEVVGSTFLGTLSTNDIQVGHLFKVYPNPTSSNVTVDLGNTYKNIDLKITNMLGQEVFKTKRQNSTKINLNIVGSTGIYFLHIKADDESKIIKLIKR
ncbi:T9SS type A sorting domain-containing protein [Aurantibacter aestuarii]|uniref:Uncharacterized protein n=1 Tax=Aurantibacter aestuarii TaxID=1266046 RepID=A0A2T1N4S8_9FLAO|nr:T9SS type A sorting domain-containing protein [Aurantibacter aestuarii]PSG86287.1 hypothetical protein C7H52_11360 [Aurantibacter aestuarii]